MPETYHDCSCSSPLAWHQRYHLGHPQIIPSSQFYCLTFAIIRTNENKNNKLFSTIIVVIGLKKFRDELSLRVGKEASLLSLQM